MVVDAPRSPTQALPRALARGSDGPFWYTLFGMRVLSDIRLPVTAEAPPADARPDLTFRLAGPDTPAPEPDGALVAVSRCDHGRVSTIVHCGPGGSWLWNQGIGPCDRLSPGLGTCHVSPNAFEVTVYPAPSADVNQIGLVLAGQIAIYVLHRRGTPSLHASAVVTPSGAAAFMGPHGQGKSTIAACLLQRGATLLTDDALPLRTAPDGVHGLPGPRLMKLWPQSVSGALGLEQAELPSLTAEIDKKLLAVDARFAFARRPAPLRALYVLDRYDPATAESEAITIRRLSGREGIATLLEHTSHSTFLQPAEAAALLPLYARLVTQAPVRVLRYPAGFAYQDAVYASILGDMTEDR